LHEKQLYEKAWLEAKRQISWYRAQIRSLVSEAWQQAEEGRGPVDAEVLAQYQEQAETFTRPIRTYMTLEALRALLHAHKALHGQLKTALTPDAPEQMTRPVSQKSSPTDEQKFAPIESTNQQPSNEFDTGNSDLNVDLQVRRPQGSVKNRQDSAEGNLAKAGQGRGDPSCATADEAVSVQKPRATKPPSLPDRPGQGTAQSCGLEYLTWAQITSAASDRFLDRLLCRTAGMQRSVLAGDCVRAAYDLAGTLGLSHGVWAEACAILGEQAAAVCVVLIDQAMHRPDKPVRKPNGYFRSMIRKSQTGELHLHKSVFGILKAGRGVANA
jgi:replication initiation protein RepC